MAKKDKDKKRGKKQEEVSEDAATDQAVEIEETPLEKAERERDELRALWQRSQADYQNLRRRQLSDIETAVRSARSGLLSEFLVVLDYLDMALLAEVESAEAKNLRVGVEMTRQQFWSSLEAQGASVIPTTGTFDAALHQAVATVETDEHEPGTILEVVRKGYRLPDFVLRHAQVKVATAPAEDAPAEATSEDSTDAPEGTTED